ncbi:hypothetical protein [Spirillospora sp. CA-294931]|uniref:hypothetical protein n=1 Tax=Spirillospora sp. CA-294931 TaxID=3240042 RepID=UPI003D93DBD8
MTAQTNVPATPEISLVEALWRFRLMSLLIVVASVAVSVGVTQFMFNGAQATARFAVTDPTNNNNVLRMGVVSGQGYATYTAQRAAFAGSTPVLTRAVQIIKDKQGPALTSEGLRGRVKTSSKPDGGVVIVSATGADMAEAATTANAVVQAYQEVTISTNTEKLDRQLQNIQAAEKKVTDQMAVTTVGSRSYRLLATNLNKLQAQASGVVSARANANDGVQFVDTADPAAAVGSKLPRNAAIGLAIGLIAACVVAFLRASATPRRPRSRPRPVVVGGPSPGPAPELGPGTDSAAPGALPPPYSRGRRARNGAAPVDPVVERSGRVWTHEEVHGRPGNGGYGNGSYGNGAPPPPPAPAPAPSAPVAPTSFSRSMLNTSDSGKEDPLSDKLDRDDKNESPAPADLWGGGFDPAGDPTRTADDRSSSSRETKPSDDQESGGTEPEADLGKGDSALMRYDLDR